MRAVGSRLIGETRFVSSNLTGSASIGGFMKTLEEAMEEAVLWAQTATPETIRERLKNCNNTIFHELFSQPCIAENEDSQS